MDPRVIMLAAAEGFFAFALLLFNGNTDDWKKAARCLLLLVPAMMIRLAFFDKTNTDYEWFLSRWIEHYRTNGGFAAMKDSIGNYNIPYLYFLAMFSYSSINDLYLIKLLSVFFDIILAYAGMRLVQKCCGRTTRGTVCFFVILYLPTVILNSAYWGQCDSIYVSFALLGLELALPERGMHKFVEKTEKKETYNILDYFDMYTATLPTEVPQNTLIEKDGSHPLLSMVCIAAAFGFKLQAVFIMPIWLTLWIWRRYKWYTFAAFPLTYLIIILPAVLLGRPFRDAVMLYADQAGTVGDALNYNSPSLTAFIRNPANSGRTSGILIAAAFAAMLLLLIIGICVRRNLTPGGMLTYTALMVLVIPFLLPHMHDRYFYCADILTTVIAVLLPLTFPAAILTQFGSIICYAAFFTGYYQRVGNTSIFLTNDRGALANALSIMVMAGALILCLMAGKRAAQNRQKNFVRK